MIASTSGSAASASRVASTPSSSCEARRDSRTSIPVAAPAFTIEPAYQAVAGSSVAATVASTGESDAASSAAAARISAASGRPSRRVIRPCGP